MKTIAIFLIDIYRNYLSIFKLQQRCRFYPTCSEYAVLALQRYGFFRGSLLSICRLLRCQPFSVGGYDPIK